MLLSKRILQNMEIDQLKAVEFSWSLNSMLPCHYCKITIFIFIFLFFVALNLIHLPLLFFLLFLWIVPTDKTVFTMFFSFFFFFRYHNKQEYYACQHRLITIIMFTSFHKFDSLIWILCLALSTSSLSNPLKTLL